MKKLLTLLLSLTLLSSCAIAQEKKPSVVKKMFYKLADIEEPTKNDDSDVMTPSKEAVMLYNDNDIKKCFDVLAKIPEPEKTPQDWLLLGNILQDQGKNTDAVFMYQKATQADKKYYKAYFNIANIYLADEKPFLAIDYYKKATHLKNDFAYGYYNLGCAYLKAGDLNKAKIVFLKAIQLNKTEPEFFYNLAYTYKKLGNEKQARQYIEFYNKAMDAKAQ